MRHAPAWVVASTFLFLGEQNPGFPKVLSGRLPALPGLTVCRIGGLLNFMADKKIADWDTVAIHVIGDYPNVSMAGGGNNYQAVTPEVQNALQRMTMKANLAAAMSTIVGIGDAVLTAGIGKITGTLDAAGREMNHIYNGVSTYNGYYGHLKQANDALGMLQTFLRKQGGDPVNILINSM